MNAFEKDGVMNFKNSQVFITRDFEGKQQVLERYSRAICFTILEAKGMEFQDVILYNYFTDSKSHSPWFILRECLAVESKKVKGNKPPHFSGGMVEYRVKSGELPDEYIEYRLSIDKTRFEQMCKNAKGSGIEDTADELKLLYVAVTRARQRLVFFDETQGVDPEKHRRSYFDGIWTELNLVSRSSDKRPCRVCRTRTPSTRRRPVSNGSKKGSNICKKGCTSTPRSASSPATAAEAMCSLRCASRRSRSRSSTICCVPSTTARKTRARWRRARRTCALMDVKEEKAKLEGELRKVALGFKDIGKLEQAAQCYSMIGDLEGCLEVYKLANMPERIAGCLVQMKRFDEAKEYYRKSNDLYGLLSAIELSGNCEEALEMITNMSQQYGEKEKEKLNAIRMRYLKQAISQFDMGLEKVADEQPTGQTEDGMEYSPPNVETNPVKLPAEEDQIEPALSKHDSLSFERVKSNSEGSFQVIDAAEALSSSNGEFDFINSEIDDLERLSESFVEVKLEGSTIKTNKTSLFEGLCEEAKEYNISINQEQIIGKVMRYCNLHFDLISKIIPHKKPEEDEPIFECDLFEVSESKFNTIMNFLEYCNSTTLRLMIEKKLEVNIQSIDIILSSVFPVSQITYPSILLSEVTMKLNQTGWKQRRLCTMGFQNILSGFQKNLLMDNIYRNYESCLPAFNTMVLLGYFRQIIPLLKPQDRCKLLEAYGEIQTLMVIKCFKEENDLWDRDAFLNDMIMNIPLDKVCKIYLNFGQDEELLNCTLAYFCNFYMWDRKTFAVPEAKVEQFKEVNASLYRLFKLLYLLFAHKLEELDCFVQSIDRRSLEENTVENGILNGVIYRISLAPSDQLFGLTRQQLFDSKGLKSLLSIILFLRLREDHLLRSDRNLFTRGLLMSFKAMNISADCMALRAFLPIGSIIHKTSPLLKEFDKSDSRCFHHRWRQRVPSH
jgi:tetratricopeptide (TPR) repeat protein